MGDSHTFDGTRPEVWFLGPTPPPVTGMTVLTREVLRGLQAAGPVHSMNWSPETPCRGLRLRFLRSVRLVRSIGKLLARGRVHNQRLYLVANSRSGLYLTIVLVCVGRCLGYKMYLHHHVYFYVDRYDWRMAWVNRCLGRQGVHVVHAAKMAADYRNRYPTECDFAVLHPSILPVEIGSARISFHRPFRLGLLSNLSIPKGLRLAIDTFAALRADGRDVTLTLAGPIPSAREDRLIRQTIAAHPDHVRCTGPVYGDDKSRFFADIDVFLFPTLTESWGLVLNEAMGAGVPVITFDRGCTATVVGATAGLLIDRNASFIEPAAQQIKQWMDHGDEYCRASQAAVAQAEHLHREGLRTLSEFADQIFAVAGAGDSPCPATELDNHAERGKSEIL